MTDTTRGQNVNGSYTLTLDGPDVRVLASDGRQLTRDEAYGVVAAAFTVLDGYPIADK